MGMKLQYNLENIGNIDKASITIKPPNFTLKKT